MKTVKYNNLYFNTGTTKEYVVLKPGFHISGKSQKV